MIHAPRNNTKANARWLVVCPVAALISCALPVAPERTCHPIAVGDGPEDFVVDTESGSSGSLLISLHNRRAWHTMGAIERVDLTTEKAFRLTRVGEPAGLSFRPHGIDLVRFLDGKQRLFVVLHGSERNAPWQGIARYRVTPKELIFEQLFEHPLLVSPNDVVALPDGSFYVSNDAGVRGNRSELVWKLHRSNVVYRRADGSWKVVADKLAYANGLHLADKKLYVTATRDNALFVYERYDDGSLGTRRKIASIRGADNIMPLADALLVTSHPKGLAFLRHARDPKKPSPTVVYRVAADDSITPVFVDSGANVSAAATAAVVNERLLMGQVFNDGMLSCDATDLVR